MSGKAKMTLRVNGENHEVAFAPHKTLLEVLREDMRLTGTKHGCELGECGTCTVLIDGQPVLSCLVLGLESDGCEITTVEGLAGPDGPHPLQHRFAETGAAQCGYCTPGILMNMTEFLKDNPAPTDDEIRHGLVGNLCRCTGYAHIVEAVRDVAKQSR